MDDGQEEGQGQSSQVAGCLVKVISHGLVLVAGVMLGYIVPILYEQVENPEIMASPEAEFSRAELIAKLEAQEKAYQDLLASTSKLDAEQKEQISSASTKVVDLEGKVAAKEKEMEVIQAKLKKTEGKSAARKKELETAQAELEALKAQLAEAVAEKERLTQELDISRQETATARQETVVAKQETEGARADEAWAKFKGDAFVRICRKGTANKLERCREELDAALSAKSGRFKQCVLSRQATPRLIAVEDKRNPSLPRNSEWMNQDSDFMKDQYFVTFCDPTLPEADGLDDL